MLLSAAVFCALCLGSSLSQRDFSRPDPAAPFNVDLQFPVQVSGNGAQLRGPSLFGASVLVASIDNSQHNLFAGAPALVSASDPSQAPGGIFKCLINLSESSTVLCNDVVPFENNKIPIINGNFARAEYAPRNRSLVGFNLNAFSKGIVSCAPNWVAKSSPEGVCFLLKNDGQVETAFKMEMRDPLRNSRPFESHALFGFSLAFNERDQSIIVGIPGFNDFSGSVSLINMDDLKGRRMIGFEANVNSKLNTYTGYSVGFLTLGRSDYILLGSPRHNKFSGKVELVDLWRKQTIHSLSSPNDVKGEYFGAALLVLEIQGTGQKDLLVSAPFFSLRNKREVGRVYLYRDLLSIMRHNRQPESIMSKVSHTGAHFGATLSTIDLNRDEFKEVIISAPFEENAASGTSGAIYIYYGTSAGIDLSSEHRIGAELSGNGLRGFGYSLWTQSDVDRNGYNDLVVGSVLSQNVTILRSVPVIKLQVNLHFDRKGINLTDTRSCLNENACFRVNYCISTSAVHPFPGDLTYSIQFVVTDGKLRLRENRVTVDKISSVISTNQNEICRENDFYVQIKKKEEIYDIITPIEVQMTVSLEKPTALKFCEWCPVASSVTTIGEIGFEHGCAKRVCLSQLELKTRFRYGPDTIGDEIVQGRYDHLEIEVDVRNLGESSIDTTLLITITPVVLSMQNSDRCRRTGDSTGFVCEVNKLLPKDKNEHFKLQFSLETIAQKNLEFELRLNSSSRMAPQSRLMASKRFSVTKEATFQLSSTNQKQNHTSFSDQTPRVLFLSSFLVRKKGPSSVNASYLQFYLPQDIIEITETQGFVCSSPTSGRITLTDKALINGTLEMPCADQPARCTEYKCSVGTFQPGSQDFNFGLTLQFTPSRISSKLPYERLYFKLRIALFTEDPFFKGTSHATIDTDVIFERQFTRPLKSSPLIMIGGGGIGLLILLITVIVLIKNGFFKRKKRDQLIQAKQRISMNPNRFPNVIPGLDLEEEEDEREREESERR